MQGINPRPAEYGRAAGYTLAALVVLGLALRCLIVFGRTNVVHPDEMFQYLEQGHRLAFGSGVVPWEYDYGIRSWFLPSILAGIMKASSWISSNPLVYIFTARLLAAGFSLVLIGFGFLVVLRRAGYVWATITGIFCAVWFHAVFLSPAILTEVFSAYLMFPAVYLANEDTPASRRTPLTLGFLLGLAFCLRFQMAPALFLIACWFCRLEFRHRWLPLVLTATAIVVLLTGVLDWLTLGTPFQSIWLNFYLNAVKGVSTAFGRLYWFRYFDYLTTNGAWIAVPLGWLALMGAFRFPLLALIDVTIVLSHSFLEHKEYRFIAFVLLSLPILVGLGAASVAQILHRRVNAWASWTSAAIIAIAFCVTSWFGWNSGFPLQYSPNTGVLDAFLAARDAPKICGLGVADYLWSMTGGYTYLNRDVPLYYSRFLSPSTRPDYYGESREIRAIRQSHVPLLMHVVMDHTPIAQFPEETLSEHTAAFNYLVAREGRSMPGYQRVGCFKNETKDWPTACLLRRAGGCSEPVR